MQFIISTKKSGSPKQAPQFQPTFFTTIVAMTKGLNMNAYSSIPFGMFARLGKKPLEKWKNPAYGFHTVAKNSGQDSHSELYKIPSRILINGFFYVCDKIRWVMMDCMEEPSGSPLSLYNGNANSVQSVTLRFASKVTVPNVYKELAHA